MVGYELLISRDTTWGNEHGLGNKASSQPGSDTDFWPFSLSSFSSLLLSDLFSVQAVSCCPFSCWKQISVFGDKQRKLCKDSKYFIFIVFVSCLRGKFERTDNSSLRSEELLSFKLFPASKTRTAYLCIGFTLFAVKQRNTKGGERFPLLPLWVCLCQLHCATPHVC